MLLLQNHFLLFSLVIVFLFSHVLKMLLFQFHFKRIFSKYMSIRKYTGYPRSPHLGSCLTSPFSLFLRKNKQKNVDVVNTETRMLKYNTVDASNVKKTKNTGPSAILLNIRNQCDFCQFQLETLFKNGILTS